MFKKQGYLYSENWTKKDINLFIDTLINLMLEDKINDVISIIQCHDFPYQKINSYCHYCNLHNKNKSEQNELLKSLIQTGVIFHPKVRETLNLNEYLYLFLLEENFSASLKLESHIKHGYDNLEFKELVIFQFFLTETYYSYGLSIIKNNHPYKKLFAAIIPVMLAHMKNMEKPHYFSLMYPDRISSFNEYSTFHCLINLATNAYFHPYLKEIYDFFEVNSFVLKYTDLHASTIFSNISFLNKLPSLTESKFNKKKYIFKFTSQVSANLYFFDSYFPEEIKYKIYTPEFFSLCLFNDYYLMVTDFNNIKEQLSFWSGLLKVKLNIDLYPTYIKILFDKYCGNTQHNLPDFSVTNSYLVNLVNFIKNDKNIADLICKDYGYFILPEHINDGIDIRKELRDSVISIFTDYHYDSIKNILTNDNNVEYNQNLKIKPTKKKRL